MPLALHYRVMEHVGSLESTQEARVALGYRLGQLLSFFRALQTSRVLHNSIVHAKHEPSPFYSSQRHLGIAAAQTRYRGSR